MHKGNFVLALITILVISGACSVGVGVNDFIKLGSFSKWLGGFNANATTFSQMQFTNPEISSFPVYQWYVLYEVQQLVFIIFEVLIGLVAFCGAGILFLWYEVKYGVGEK